MTPSRRAFVASLAGAAASPLLMPVAARAQRGERVRRIGVLAGADEDNPATISGRAALIKALEDRGWSDKRNIQFENRWGAVNLARIQAFAEDLVEQRLDVIVASTTQAVAALQRRTKTIPIVFVTVSDPIGSGFVESLPRRRCYSAAPTR